MEIDSIVNIVLVALLALGGLMGFARGFLQQAIELAGGVLTVVIAIAMAGSFAEYLDARMDVSYTAALILAFAIIVVAGVVLTHLLALSIGKVVKMTMLRFFDHLTGAVLGLIMAGIVASLLVTLTLELPIKREVRERIATADMVLFLRPIAGSLFNWVVDHTSKSKRYEEIFKRGNAI